MTRSWVGSWAQANDWVASGSKARADRDHGRRGREARQSVATRSPRWHNFPSSATNRASDRLTALQRLLSSEENSRGVSEATFCPTPPARQTSFCNSQAAALRYLLLFLSPFFYLLLFLSSFSFLLLFLFSSFLFFSFCLHFLLFFWGGGERPSGSSPASPKETSLSR